MAAELSTSYPELDIQGLLRNSELIGSVHTTVLTSSRLILKFQCCPGAVPAGRICFMATRQKGLAALIVSKQLFLFLYAI